jgi:hypothetical protein
LRIVVGLHLVLARLPRQLALLDRERDPGPSRVVVAVLGQLLFFGRRRVILRNGRTVEAHRFRERGQIRHRFAVRRHLTLPVRGAGLADGDPPVGSDHHDRRRHVEHRWPCNERRIVDPRQRQQQWSWCGLVLRLRRSCLATTNHDQRQHDRLHHGLLQSSSRLNVNG